MTENKTKIKNTMRLLYIVNVYNITVNSFLFYDLKSAVVNDLSHKPQEKKVNYSVSQ